MNNRITPAQLQREAYVYVRQSTSAQVHEHVESKKRQYALAERAKTLGWSPAAVHVVDEDQGKSGASADGRKGFERIAHAVAHGKAGAIFAVEVSRLSRSSQDWQRLLSLCAVAQVLVIDEQAIYDPSHRDDKLLLDLKGAMSEQELHWLALRLAGGRLNQARRGESYIHPAIGYVWGGRGLELDPDEAVQSAVRVIFERFSVEPSARAVLRWAQQSNFQLPVRRSAESEIEWRPIGNLRLNNILHSPVYAGVYVYGRHQTRKQLVDGEIRKVRTRLASPTDWPVRIDNAHPGYITWDEYVSNQEKLRRNRSMFPEANSGAPREGCALLGGLALCGRCGRRMGARYQTGSSRFAYCCSGESSKGEPVCWSVPGAALDEAVAALFLRTTVPDEIELSLAVDQEVGQQADSLDRAWRSRLEQARYEARRAERRYKAVDPDNRVVARTLEAEWERRLRELETVEQQYEETRRQHLVALSPEDRQRIRELARDLPKVWRAKTTSMADRKAMLRLVIEAIAVHPVDVPRRLTKLRVQWVGGAVNEIEIARPASGESHQNDPMLVERIAEMARSAIHDDVIARTLNEEGLRTGTGRPWTGEVVCHLRSRKRIPKTAPDLPRLEPLPHQHPDDGLYSVPGLMARFDVPKHVVHGWIRRGVIQGTRRDFGSHRNVYWFDLDTGTVKRLRAYSRSLKERGSTKTS